MTVVYKAGEQKLFTANEVLWGKKELVDAMIKSALISQTEGFIEMIIDGQEDMSRNGINETLRGVKDSAQDLINDLMADLHQALNARLKEMNYGVAVTGMKFDLAGDVTDIEVDVTVSAE
jgi:type II secretory pathway component PulC